MLFETLGQAQVFLVMTAVGAVLGLIYDFVRLARRNMPRAGAIITDVLFCAVVIVLCILSMQRIQMGALRPYVLLGVAVGWFLYGATFSYLGHSIAQVIRDKSIGKKQQKH